MSNLKLTLVDRRNPKNQRDIQISSNSSLQSLLDVSAKELGIEAKKVFLEDGGEVDSVEMLRSGDVIYVSSGNTDSRARKTNASSSKSTTNGKGGDDVSSAPVYSIAVLGGGAVGKSALTLRYVKNLFVGDYDPTIEDAYRKNAMVDGKTVVLDLLDTAGQDNFTSLRSHWMRNKQGLIFVFSLIDENSVSELIGFLDQCKQIYEEDPQPPTVLVGNKADCSASERKVSAEEGPRLVETYGLTAYVETSALTGLNVDVVFETAVREAQRKNLKFEPEGGSSGKRKILGIACNIL